MESQFFKILILSLLLKNLEGTPNNSTELDAEDFLNVYFLPNTLVLESDLVDGDGILVDNGTFNRNADVDSALSTMSYHRSMINKYLCRNYLANEILSEVDGGANIPVPAIHTHLHHGGAALNNLPPLAGTDYGGLHHGVDYGGGHGYSHIPDHHVHVDHDHGHYHGHGHGHDEEKGLALKDLFDLALTALAFLAFGMFVLNLILTCFSVQPPTVVMMMNGGGEGGEETRFTRVKRGAINPEYLNQVSYNVVRSIDALASLQQGSPHQEHCLRLSLCESNKFARELPSQQQVWVPVWSFGLSWISGKMRGKSESMLEYLRAIILGMGKAQCERVYSQCKQEM
ncbi:uncharacterized protein LOC120354097 [Nilaparvata lugens]|uniref:uncharacterized protein LOC120354097 n=1 Tax=Nilaparvata lugens TaxID=108931 RepID=UPI00193CB28D|nr:uncharacterized protein LOC120354097 [Nilaparvata lugens]